jgi:hypothetical protein
VQGGLGLKEIITGTQKAKSTEDRRKQLKALFHKYASQYEITAFADYLKNKHGIVLLIHSKEGKKAYGYSVIDHSAKNVYKGSDIMPLPALMQLASTGHSRNKEQTGSGDYKETISEPFRRNYYKAILKAAMQNYPDIRQGLHHTGIGIYLRDDRYYLADHADKAFIALDQILATGEYEAMMHAFAQSGELNAEISRQHIDVPSPLIASDIDDEAIHGRNRRRRRHPRTNSR